MNVEANDNRTKIFQDTGKENSSSSPSSPAPSNARQIPLHINSKLNHVFSPVPSLNTAAVSASSSRLEKMLNSQQKNKKTTQPQQQQQQITDSNELSGNERNGSLVSGMKNNGTYIIFGATAADSAATTATATATATAGLLFNSKNKSTFEAPVLQLNKRLPALKKQRHKKLNHPTFLRRRLLSFNDLEPSVR